MIDIVEKKDALIGIGAIPDGSIELIISDPPFNPHPALIIFSRGARGRCGKVDRL